MSDLKRSKALIGTQLCRIHFFRHSRGIAEQTRSHMFKVTVQFKQCFQFISCVFFVLRHTHFNLYTVGMGMKFSK